MADRVHPSAKPVRNGTSTATGAAANAQQVKAQAPGRIPYRPRPVYDRRTEPRRWGCRRFLCICGLWSVLILSVLLLLAATAGATFYVIYRPQRPAFSLSSLKISQFNLTTAPSDGTTRLSAKLSLALSAKNPDPKMIYAYDPISLTAYSGQVPIGNGSFPGFVSNPNNITIIHSTLSMPTQLLDSDSVSGLEPDLKKKNGLPVKISMDTMVQVKLEKMKSKKVGIRVTCEGIRAPIPKGKVPTAGTTSGAHCTVDLRVTIWKWTF
ncbi:unnamed protein product [Cuscuta campestris]|uniref:Late embryogenesis abundant protein LEA-2 subgroup domain-containing protein n=1 Tax=Cuscuta campestris TaxID=132261 RepID=A0A484M0C2_9ASTE|nr:unnamed protein product [Cuscuta campestris]